MTLLSQMMRFGVVGTIGFCVDGGVLVSLIQLGVDPYLARLMSFPVAVLATWWLNRVWTFAGRPGRPIAGQVTGYFAVQIIGALVNYLVYAAVLSTLDATSLNALLALAIGSIAGMTLNFLGARHIVFSDRERQDEGAD